jgi:hypothetical protein
MTTTQRADVSPNGVSDRATDAERLQEIQDRLIGVTEEPWKRGINKRRNIIEWSGMCEDGGMDRATLERVSVCIVVDGSEQEENLNFILHSREDIPYLVARLSASEERVKELERENEWRGLLVKLCIDGWVCDRIEDGRCGWVIYSSFGDEEFRCHDANGLPARPSDEIVAKVKEEVNG